MKFKMLQGDEGDPIENAWTEEYIEDVDSIEEAEQWCQNVVQAFNKKLMPKENRRKFYSVEQTGDDVGHNWARKTVSKNAYPIDVKCRRCGITGMRTSWGETRRDSPYMGQKYKTCNPKPKD